MTAWPFTLQPDAAHNSFSTLLLKRQAIECYDQTRRWLLDPCAIKNLTDITKKSCVPTGQYSAIIYGLIGSM